jgi:oligopeptide transport system substrate-binding protein
MHKRLLGLLATTAIVFAACGGATSSSAPATSAEPGTSSEPAASAPAASGAAAAEQILRVDIGGEPPTLDLNKAQDSNSIAILSGLARGLVYVDAENKVVPSLAESWDVSADAKTLTFHLGDNKYSNGEPIVAGDFVRSIRRLVDPRTAAPYSYVAAEIAGAGDLLALAGADPMPADAEIDAALDKLGVSAPDDKTVVITLGTPATYFLSALTLWVFNPIQESWINTDGSLKTEAGDYVSSGPFILDTWDHQSSIVMKPNPNWTAGETPKLSEIRVSMSPEPAQAMASYETGEIDMLLPVPSEDIERVKNDPVLSTQYSEDPALSITYYTFNNGTDPSGKGVLKRCQGADGTMDFKKCPTANKDFRIALTQAVDKQAFQDATFAGTGKIACSMVMPGLPGAVEDYCPYTYDLTAAKASMDKALAAMGVASAADLGALKFGFNSGSGHEPRVAFLAQAWKDAFGLETEQIGSEFGVFLSQRTAGDYDLARDGWGADYPHANNQIAGLFTCGGGNNDDQYCNPAVDDLITQAAAEPDQAKQAALYEQAGKIISDDAAALFLRWGVSSELVQPYVSGLQKSPMDSVVPGERHWETISMLEH